MWTGVGARHLEVENDGVEHFGGTATLRKMTQEVGNAMVVYV